MGTRSDVPNTSIGSVAILKHAQVNCHHCWRWSWYGQCHRPPICAGLPSSPARPVASIIGSRREKITDNGGSAISIPTDVTSASGMTSTMDQVKAHFGSDINIAAAVYNVASKFMRKPFLEQSSEEFLASLEPSVKGAFNFAQATLPLMLNISDVQYPPTLIFTGRSHHPHFSKYAVNE